MTTREAKLDRYNIAIIVLGDTKQQFHRFSMLVNLRHIVRFQQSTRLILQKITVTDIHYKYTLL